MSKKLSKDYILKFYKLAYLDYLCAHTDDEQWNARKRMASLERDAMTYYGFDFSDSLKEVCHVKG